MRLYQMELYKICHRKTFIIGLGCVIGIILFYFHIRVCDEGTCVNGIYYQKYEAVQINKQITEEFRGVLTDEKVEKIIEKYGLPKEVSIEYESYCTDANFLNEWVVQYLSDGYFNSYRDYKLPTCIYPIEETELGEVRESTGNEIIMEYHDGWYIFFEVLTISLILGSILILCNVSTVFSNEKQSKMLPLLFTTKEGRRIDIYVKIAAVFTVAVSIWFVIVCFDLLLCWLVYGLDGLKSMIGITKIHGYLSMYRRTSLLSVGSFLVIVLIRSLVGILLLSSITICISAHVKSSFHAVMIAILFWAAPIFIWMILPGYYNIVFMMIRILINMTPMFLVMYNTLYDYYRIYRILIGAAAVISIVCTISACRKFSRLQRV